jgi:hypothetical protein
VKWATKVIAHLDPQQPERVPKYHELRDALDVLASVTGRYQSLLNQSVTGDWTPAIQGDWYAALPTGAVPIPSRRPLAGLTLLHMTGAIETGGRGAARTLARLWHLRRTSGNTSPVTSTTS